MQITGDDGKWKYGSVGFGMTAALIAAWFVYETTNKKTRKRKHRR